MVANAWYGSWDPDLASDITTSITTPSTDYVKTTDSLLQYLDKSRMSTAILYDRVFPMANVQAFNSSRADTSANKHFRQAYKEMFDAAYNKQNWLPPTIVSKIAQGKALVKATVPMAIANYRFNVIDTNALVNGTIIQRDSMYYDASPTSNPYKTISTLMVSPLVDSVISNNNNISYTFSPELYINQSNLPITIFRVNFGNGTADVNIPVNSNFTTTVNYSTSGFKTIRLTASFSNGSVKVTYALIKVKVASATLLTSLANTCNRTDTLNIWSKIPFQGYENEASASLGFGNVKIFYATNGACDGVLRKPIIVVDGFDPEDKRPIDELYDNFLDNVERGKLATDLRAQGYDVVVLNFPSYDTFVRVKYPFLNSLITILDSRDGGADYIERNAMVLIALINRINALKQGTEKLTIIGPSMGGLISRYALSYMEKNNMPHKTKLWISFDSPHKGANIAIGDQYFLDFFGSMAEAAKKNLDDKIGSVAAKQMLVNHHLGNPFIYSVNTVSPAGAPGFRDRFQAALDAMGFPKGDIGQPFRKISLLDGNLSGNQLNAACQKGFTMDVRRLKQIKTFLFKIRYRTYTVASAKMYFTPNYGNSCMAFEGKSAFTSSKYKYPRYAYTPSNTVGYDTAPGGTFPTQQILEQEGNIETKMFGGVMTFESKFYSVIPTHSFINTKSALAFKGTNQDLAENISTRNLVCTNETPFDSYFADFNQNRDHVELWPAAVDWVKKEIMVGPQAPSVKSPYTISGPTVICTSSAVYNIPNLPTGTTVTWSSTGNVTIVSNYIGNSVTLTSNPGIGKLIATINNACGRIGVDSKIITTRTLPNTDFTGVQDISPQGYKELRCVAKAPIQSDIIYDWKLDGISVFAAWRDRCYILGPDCNIQPTKRWYRVEYQATEPCGRVTTTCKMFEYICFYSNINNFIDRGSCTNNLSATTTSSSTFTYYPNPANNELIVTSINSTNDIGNNVITNANQFKVNFEIELYDDKGKKVSALKNNLSDKEIVIDTRDLPNGNYYLHIIDGTEVIKKQIVITH